MERLTLQEWEALYDRHKESLQTEDYFHARTASAMCGKAPHDLMAFKPKPGALLGPDGKPVSPSFDDVVRQFL
jgi:hypothetical protein